MKKVLILVFMILSILLLVNSKDVYAYPVDYYVEEMTKIENELTSNNTTVVSQLDSSINYYTEKLNDSSYPTTSIRTIIDYLQKSKDNYILYKSNTDVQTPSLVYISAVTAAIAFFELNEYKLSSELLAYSIYNKDTNTVYEPINMNIVCHSDYYRYEAVKTDLSGSISFKRNGTNKIENDCFFSLHNVSYTRESSSTKNLIIEDTYDYKRSTDEFEGIVQTVVNLVADAMTAGYITSYHIRFNPGDPHTNYEYIYVSEYKHDLLCKNCDIKKELVSHTYNTYEKYNQDNHKAICPCGASHYESHTWVPARLNNLVKSEDLPNYVPGYRCRYCGQTKYSDEV